MGDRTLDVNDLNRMLGNADLMLIDKILKGSFEAGAKILDAGCGELRNIHFFIKNNFNVYGIDRDRDIISMSRLVARSINSDFVTENIIHASIEDNPFPVKFFDHILCLNVLHSAEDAGHFEKMLSGLRRVLRDDGKLFLSMETISGFKDRIKKNDHGLFTMPTGETRLLFDEEVNRIIENKLNFTKTEPMRYLHIEDAGNWVYIWLKKDRD